MFNKFLALLSRTIGYFALAMSAIFYVQQLIQRPTSEVFTVGLSAFVLIAGLSGLCFSIIPCLPSEADKGIGLYAGEKFFHSSLLLLQTVVLRYAIDGLLAVQWIVDYKWVKVTVSILGSSILVLLGTVATYFSLYGFQAVNDFFWRKYTTNRVEQPVVPKEVPPVSSTIETETHGKERLTKRMPALVRSKVRGSSRLAK